MNLDDLKGKQLDDATFDELKKWADDMTGKLESARSESITGRKQLKQRAETAEALAARMMEKLGIESADDLETMPDAKGAAEAAKQYEAKMKRLERQVADLSKEKDEITGKFRQSQTRAIVADAISAHEFVARDMVETYISNRLVWEGDDLLYKQDDGKLSTIRDAVAGIAKSRPELLKSAGTGGAGVRPGNAGGGTAKTMTRADYEALPPDQRLAAAKEGVQLT